MSTSFDSSKINELIAEQRYEEAKYLLRESDDPEAKKWLAHLERRFPATMPPDPRNTGFSSFNLGTSGDVSSIPIPRDRGGCLTLWLTLALIGNPLIGLYYAANANMMITVLHVPAWIVGAYTMLAAAQTLCVIGMWFWQKWAAQFMMVLFIGGVIFSVGIFGLSVAGLSGLVGVGVLYWLMRDRWHMFA